MSCRIWNEVVDVIGDVYLHLGLLFVVVIVMVRIRMTSR